MTVYACKNGDVLLPRKDCNTFHPLTQRLWKTDVPGKGGFCHFTPVHNKRMLTMYKNVLYREVGTVVLRVALQKVLFHPENLQVSRV